MSTDQAHASHQNNTNAPFVRSQHDERLITMVYRACLKRGLHEHIAYILTRDLMFRAWRSRVYDKAKPVPSMWGSKDTHKHLLSPEMIEALMYSINCGCFDMGLKRTLQSLLFPDFSFADRAAFTQGPVMYAGHMVHLYDRMGAWAHGMGKMSLIDAVSPALSMRSRQGEGQVPNSPLDGDGEEHDIFP